MLILGVLAAFVVLIALAWFLVLRRLDEGNFEVGRRLQPPWTRAKAAALGLDAEGEQGAVHAWSAERLLEREEHAGTANALDQSKDRNAARSWGG
jgi:hypothetical protein